MSVASKLQIKPGQSVVVLNPPAGVDLDIAPDTAGDDASAADVVVVFVDRADELGSTDAGRALEAARRDAIAWFAYPKAGQRGTDLNRDSLAARLTEEGVRPVRQIAIDDVWSALRFRPA